MRDKLNMHHTRWELRDTCSICDELYVIVRWYSAPQWLSRIGKHWVKKETVLLMQLLKYVIYLLIGLPHCGRSYDEAGTVEDGIKDPTPLQKVPDNSGQI